MAYLSYLNEKEKIFTDNCLKYESNLRDLYNCIMQKHDTVAEKFIYMIICFAFLSLVLPSFTVLLSGDFVLGIGSFIIGIIYSIILNRYLYYLIFSSPRSEKDLTDDERLLIDSGNNLLENIKGFQIKLNSSSLKLRTGCLTDNYADTLINEIQAFRSCISKYKGIRLKMFFKSRLLEKKITLISNLKSIVEVF